MKRRKKDNLLDAESNEGILGKLAGQDVETGTSTFVTVLGMEDERKMWTIIPKLPKRVNEINLIN